MCSYPSTETNFRKPKTIALYQVTPTSEVQVITAAATASDLDGYFFVGFEGHWSERVAYDATADEMASALAGIPAVGQVQVKECMYFGVGVGVGAGAGVGADAGAGVGVVVAIAVGVGLVSFPVRIVEPVMTSFVNLRRNLVRAPPPSGELNPPRGPYGYTVLQELSDTAKSLIY